MDLLVIGSQETRNSYKRVRRNGEGKTDLLCSKRFLTRHCVLRTVLTLSHTSWSHYSKVFFVKGKGGKRASRISSERQQKEESRGWQREGPQRRAARQRKGRRRRKRTRERERDKLQREQKEAGPVTQAFFSDASQFPGSPTFLNSLAASCFLKFFKNCKLIKVKNFGNSQFELREKSGKLKLRNSGNEKCATNRKSAKRIKSWIEKTSIFALTRRNLAQVGNWKSGKSGNSIHEQQMKTQASNFNSIEKGGPTFRRENRESHGTK